MALRRRASPARGLLRAGAQLAVLGTGLAAAPAVLTAGLVTGSARATGRTAKTLAESAARVVGTVVTGADPMPDGHVHSLVDAVKAMVEPPTTRHAPRVWADRGHVQVELGVPTAEESPEVRRTLRHALERLDGGSWATVKAVAGRGLVAVGGRGGAAVSRAPPATGGAGGWCGGRATGREGVGDSDGGARADKRAGGPR